MEDIMPNFWNPNCMSSSMFEKMKQTIEQKGLFGSIICRKYGDKYQILDGEHRMKACKELGYTDLPVECCIDEITDEEVKFWTIHFNNTRGKDDIEKRSKILDQLSQGQIQLLPFTEEEIQHEKDLFKFDFSQYETIDPGIPENELVHIFSLKFSNDEWKSVSQIMETLAETMTPKQWFIKKIMQDIDLQQFRTINQQLSPVIT